ncbi:uncharacterized protein LOC118564219 isoform X2 [Fundulus heteroclitus]|uniref:uncharacterized protein LOC118564219 isoform X2 n=1 Tax=Fundulus heteroclitus TaxID=8078 RepID=UPI00165CAC45|nr:uncharacterized protein LOC118564219 isoform X2 [Fundulus heteroclitus]
MEKYWLKGVSKRLKKIHDARVEQEVVIIQGEEKDFMNIYINELQEKQNMYFKAPVSTHKDYHYYACERASKASGQSKGESQKTRANSCEAYISFKFITDSGFRGVVIHKMLQHTGHDVSNEEDGIKNRIHPELLGFVEMWLTQGCSTSETLLKSCDWAHRNGHVDKQNRRFYLTPEDVRLIKKNLHGVTFPHRNDSVSVDYLVNTELQQNICFYQPLIHQQPLIIVVQTPSQKKLLEENPHPMVFMDASYKGITAYGYAFYALLLINKTGRGVPFAYFIMSKESSETLSLCIQELQRSNPSFYPRSVMIDRDLKVLNAVKHVFPDAKVLLCWFHVLQVK